MMKQPVRMCAVTLVLLVLALWLGGCGGGGNAPPTMSAVPSSSVHGAGVFPANGGGLLGDMDDDGQPSVGDAIKILRIVVDLDEDNKPCADANENGGTDVGDALKVLRCVVALDPWPIGYCGGGLSTVVGYVGAGVGAAQNGGPPPLQLLTDPPAEPVAMALVKLQTNPDTVEVRTLHNGYFAAEIPAGVVTVTAYPPEDKQDQHSISTPVNVTAVEGEVTEVDGTTTGAPPTVPPADFFPCNVSDKRATDSVGWSEDGGDWDVQDWLGVIIGTTSVGGQTAYVLVGPHGLVPGVTAMQAEPQYIAGAGMILRPGSDGSMTLYGLPRVVDNGDGTYEVVADMFDTPIVWPVMSLGKQYTSTTTLERRTINVDLAPNFSLADLDPGDFGFPIDPCPASLTINTRLTGIGVPVGTPAGTFADTIVLSLTFENTWSAYIITDEVQMTLARDIGTVAEQGVYVRRDVGQPSGTGDVIEWYHDLLFYARVGGVEYGTAP